jgi:hypothetical protein
LVAIVAGIETEQVIEQVSKIDLKKRQAVIEITLDMANSMKLIAKKCFPKATQVTDCFTHSFYYNFGIRDTASLNSCTKTSLRSVTRN